MAIECWVWGNANPKDPDIQEYQIRLCGARLRERDRRDRLIELSNRMLSVTKRRAELRTQRCWFAGHLDEEVYMIALAGEQNNLLGTNLVGSRGLYCMLAYGFTGEDIRGLRRDEGVFEPLKELMRAINETGKCPPGPGAEQLREHFASYTDALPTETEGPGRNNIVRSGPEADEALWRQSLTRPAAMGILSADDAERLLNNFPDGIVSVMENVSYYYQPRLREPRDPKVLEEGKRVTETLYQVRDQDQKCEEPEVESVLRPDGKGGLFRRRIPEKSSAVPYKAPPNPQTVQVSRIKRVLALMKDSPKLEERIKKALDKYEKDRPLKWEDRQKMKEFCTFYSVLYGFSEEIIPMAYEQVVLKIE